MSERVCTCILDLKYTNTIMIANHIFACFLFLLPSSVYLQNYRDVVYALKKQVSVEERVICFVICVNFTQMLY